MATPEGRCRLSLEVSPLLHKKLKTMAAIQGVTVKDLVVNCLDQHLFVANELNEETLKAFKETDLGKGLVHCKDIHELLDQLGLNG